MHHYRAGSDAIRKVLSPTHIHDVTTESGFFARDVLNNNHQASTVETEGASPPNCLHASAFQTAGFKAEVSSPASGFETTTKDKTPINDEDKKHKPSQLQAMMQVDPDVLHWQEKKKKKKVVKPFAASS